MATGETFDTPVLRVHVRQLWTQDWTEVTTMEPVRATVAANPAVSQAEFVIPYGAVLTEGSAAWQSRTIPTDYKNWFVRLQHRTAADPETWESLFFGWFQREEIIPHSPQEGGTVPTGDLRLTAYGLETILDRRVLSTTETKRKWSGVSIPITDVLTFNKRHEIGFSEQGNRSIDRIGDSYIFSNYDGEVWTAENIVEYMIDRIGPTDMTIRILGQYEALANIKPVAFRPQGMTIAAVLNTLVNRRLGLGWTIRVDEDTTPERLEIHIFSVFDEDVTYGDGTPDSPTTSIQRNLEQNTIDLDSRYDLDDAYFVLDSLSKYDQVMVTGARIKSIFSLSFEDNIGRGWTLQEQTGYTNATDDERLNDTWDNVYTVYHMDESWAWANATVGSGPGAPVVPTISDDGTYHADLGANYKEWGHRFLRELPSLKAWSTGTAEKEYREPLLLVKYNGTYYHADRPPPDAPWPPLQMEMLSAAFGFQVRAPGHNHILAMNHGDVTDSVTQPVLDYKDMVATVAIEADERLRVIAPSLSGQPHPAQIRTIEIDVPDAEFWYLAPGTVIGLDADNELERSPTAPAACVLRNDVHRLRAISALARKWYGVDRMAIRVVQVGIETDYPPGSLLTATTDSFDRETVMSVVTSVTYDLQTMRTTITTGFETPDFAAFF